MTKLEEDEMLFLRLWTTDVRPGDEGLAHGFTRKEAWRRLQAVLDEIWHAPPPLGIVHQNGDDGASLCGIPKEERKDGRCGAMVTCPGCKAIMWYQRKDA